MEETHPDSTWSDDRSLKTAESLRVLRDQADQTLGDHRQCVSNLENRLTEQLQYIADEIARERLADETNQAFSAEQTSVIKELERSLAEKETEVLEVLEQLASQSLEIEAQILERDEELEQLLELGEAENQEQESLRQELESARQSIKHLKAQECAASAQTGDELDEMSQQFEQLEQELSSLQEQHQQQTTELELALQKSQTAQEKSDQTAASLAESAGSAAEVEAEAEGRIAEIAKQLAEVETCLAEAEGRTVEASLRVTEAESRASDAEERAAEASEQATESEARVAGAVELATTAERSAATAGERIAELEQIQESSQENSEKEKQEAEQTHRKFELALADAHKLKRENAALQEELVSRPEASEQESPELACLRAERDVLAERVSELENIPTSAGDEETQQEQEDLQRRFELAVDDVRHLKQENADLHEKLKTAPPSKATVINDGPLDWQAQKEKLLASLEAEDQGLLDEPRRKERATIKETVLTTERAIAEKDALLNKNNSELAKLRKQMGSKPTGKDLDALREQLTEEILGDDEAIQTARTKLQQRQQELDDKLREAELEISVERATLARDQATLKDKLAKIADQESSAEEKNGEKPRRRWLSALGIKDDKEDSESPK